MKKANCFLLFFLFYCHGFAGTIDQKKTEELIQFLNVRNDAEYIYPTKFGDLKFIKDDGALGIPSEKITLNNKPFVVAKEQSDSIIGSMSVMPDIMSSTAIDSAPRRPGQSGKTEVYRMVVLLGEDGNCIKKFIILDFTGNIPFASERFGDNPDGQACFTFKKAKWGKKQSEIIIDGPRNYIYSAYKKVMGPFAYE